jgi:hypothetical protein
MEKEPVIKKSEFVLRLPATVKELIGVGGRGFNVSAINFNAGAGGSKEQVVSRTVTLNLEIENAGREVFAKPLIVSLFMSAGDAIWLSERLKEQAGHAEAFHVD